MIKTALIIFGLETGISVALAFGLFNFCIAMMDSTTEMTNKIVEDMKKSDFEAINSDLREMDNYIRGLGYISANYLEISNFKKDNLTEENIKKLKETVGRYERTENIEKLEKFLEEIYQK